MGCEQGQLAAARVALWVLEMAVPIPSRQVRQNYSLEPYAVVYNRIGCHAPTQRSCGAVAMRQHVSGAMLGPVSAAGITCGKGRPLRTPHFRQHATHCSYVPVGSSTS